MTNVNEITASPRTCQRGSNLTICYKFSDAQSSVTLDITWTNLSPPPTNSTQKVTITKGEGSEEAGWGCTTITFPVTAASGVIDDPDGDAQPEVVAGTD